MRGILTKSSANLQHTITAEMAEDFGLIDKVIDKRPEMPQPGAVS